MKKAKYEIFELRDLFNVKRGTIHSSSALDEGKIPLVSCKADYNGIDRSCEVAIADTFSKAITVASDGQPLATFYHNYEFGAKDNVLVCLSKKKLNLSTVYFIVTELNRQRWRYSYGRKCYLNRVNKVHVFCR